MSRCEIVNYRAFNKAGFFKNAKIKEYYNAGRDIKKNAEYENVCYGG
jgi:hypothetical protein